MNCRNCGIPITGFFSLGDMPLVNSFLREGDLDWENKYDLSVGFCQKCYLVQLINSIPPKELFEDYIYFSSTSKFFVEHCKKTAEHLARKLSLSSGSLVLEIASNDGVQLQAFKDLGIGILGVDPAKNIAEAANEKGVPTMAEFFNHDFAKKIKREKNIQADLIFGANVLAHVPEIKDFVGGVGEALKPKGTAVFEFPYLKGLLENKFDTIYHEHVFYYSLIALINLFKAASLDIYDVDMTPMQGGSLRIFICHQGAFPVRESVGDLIKEEVAGGFDNLETYQKMSENIQNLKKDIISLLERLKKEGKTVAAYSAPAKGNILLNYFGIGKNYLDFIVDRAESKQGLYTPGTHLLVYPVEKIYQEKPDYLLVLCWNLAEEVMTQLEDYHADGGKFIIPVPEIKII